MKITNAHVGEWIGLCILLNTACIRRCVGQRGPYFTLRTLIISSLHVCEYCFNYLKFPLKGLLMFTIFLFRNLKTDELAIQM